MLVIRMELKNENLIMVCNMFVGGGGGVSVRVIAFCLDRLGLNPGTDLGFFQFRIALNLFMLGCWVFSNNV